MGIPTIDAVLVCDMLKHKKEKNLAVGLGYPTIGYTGEYLYKVSKMMEIDIDEKFLNYRENLTAEDFFKINGFKKFIAIDVSDYEGADIQQDLNHIIDDKYKDIADLIYDCGTTEHVFNILAVFQNINKLLKKGGWVVHHSPSNDYLDHGFYQLSPTLFFDFYGLNQYKTISASVIEGELSKVFAINKNLYYGNKRYFYRAYIQFVAEKSIEQSESELKIPIQGCYDEIFNGKKRANNMEFQYNLSLKFSILKKLYIYSRVLYKNLFYRLFAKRV